MTYIYACRLIGLGVCEGPPWCPPLPTSQERLLLRPTADPLPVSRPRADQPRACEPSAASAPACIGAQVVSVHVGLGACGLIACRHVWGNEYGQVCACVLCSRMCLHVCTHTCPGETHLSVPLPSCPPTLPALNPAFPNATPLPSSQALYPTYTARGCASALNTRWSSSSTSTPRKPSLPVPHLPAACRFSVPLYLPALPPLTPHPHPLTIWSGAVPHTGRGCASVLNTH